MLTQWRWSLRMLARDVRAGELRLLVAALVVAVGSTTAVAFFTDRIQQALQLQASELLAADLRIASDHPIAQRYVDRARELNLVTTPTQSFRTMAVAQAATQLVELKAVGTDYPLRGAVRVAPAPFAPDAVMQGAPLPGSVWVEQRLLTALALAVGQNLTLGEMEFKVAGVLTYEPDRAGDLFSIAPRVLVNLVDMPRTGLVQEGSRVVYRLLVAGTPAAVHRYRAALESQLQRGEELEDIRQARPEIRQALARAQQFLGLAALVAVVLASVALAMAARRFAERHLDGCAVMRCLGAQQSQIVALYLWQIIWIGLVGSALGCGLGFVAQYGLVYLLGALVFAQLPAPTLWPVALGILVGMTVLSGFVLPMVLRLRRVPTLRVLRRELGPPGSGAAGVYLLGLVAIGALAWLQAGEPQLAAYALGGLVGVAFVYWGAAYALVAALRGVLARGGVAWRFGLAGIVRRGANSVAQIMAFGLGMTVMLLLALVRGDLLAAWQGRIPEHAPNYFFINIQPDRAAPVREFLVGQGVAEPSLYPMVRGRLEAINGRPVRGVDFADERAARLAERETNLTWSSQLPPDNKIVAGHWWQTTGATLSLEDGIAKTLGIQLGDRLRYAVAGESFEAEVTSLRTVEWGSFNANFFVIAAPGVLESYPATYMTSVYVPPERAALLDTLVRQFPGVTVVDISAIMGQVRNVMDRVSQAVEYVFLFTLAAGFLVLYAGIQATQDERVLENAVLRALGAKRSVLLAGLIAEFAVLGLLSGGLAALAASLLSYILSTRVFDLAYHFNPALWWIGCMGGAMSLALAGYLGTRRVLAQPPLQVLRG